LKDSSANPEHSRTRRRPLSFQVGDGRLLAVPSIHDHHVFADEVHRICSHRETRPDVIAVELGHQITEAAVAWLKELGVGAGRAKKLPLMLGLTSRNRVIRSSFERKAMTLQETTGQDLSELPPETLYRELNYAGLSLLCLSPTDSIIEAMRCSLELGLPVYGVDLEEMPNHLPKRALIQDPLGPENDLETYVRQNAAMAAKQRDEEIDEPREIVMAARLKTLMLEYGRLLFVCGLGHWASIERLLEEAPSHPARISRDNDKNVIMFERVVVHPVIAIQHMDLFPAFTEQYERSRKPASVPVDHSAKGGTPDPRRAFNAILAGVYKRYFGKEALRRGGQQRSQDLVDLGGFEARLKNECVLNLREMPNAFMTVRAAHHAMSKEFVNALVDGFMKVRWASPRKHPDCSVLLPSRHEGLGPVCSIYRGDGSPVEESRYSHYLPGAGSADGEPTIAYDWKDDPRIRMSWRLGGVLHTWPPWERLISSMSMRASGEAQGYRLEKRTEPFRAGIMWGIDIRASLRSALHGKDRIYVHNKTKKRSPSPMDPVHGFPVVWILEPGRHRGASMTALFEDFRQMREYVKDREGFDEMRRARGDKMIALIGYGRDHVPSRPSRAYPLISTARYSGILIYQPISWTHSQFAGWMEMTGYSRNPICNDNGLMGYFPSDLVRLFEQKCGLKMRDYDWETLLILQAIPFAENLVTVVAPEGHAIDPIVYERAERSGIDIVVTPLSAFSQQELDRLPLNHMAPALSDDNECTFSEHISEAIGELATNNIELVPPSVSDFGDGGHRPESGGRP